MLDLSVHAYTAKLASSSLSKFIFVALALLYANCFIMYSLHKAKVHGCKYIVVFADNQRVSSQ